LLSAKINEFAVESGEVAYKPELKPLPIQNLPIAITLAKIDETLIVDPSLDEEQAMSARLTVASDGEGRVCAMQKGGSGVFTVEEIKRAVSLALSKAPEIRSRVVETVRK
jgi:exosome complex component RRP42